MADIITAIVVTPIMMGIFLLGLGIAIVMHLKTTRYLGNGLATVLGFIALTLTMVGCIWLLDQLRFF